MAGLSSRPLPPTTYHHLLLTSELEVSDGETVPFPYGVSSGGSAFRGRGDSEIRLEAGQRHPGNPRRVRPRGRLFARVRHGRPARAAQGVEREGRGASGQQRLSGLRGRSRDRSLRRRRERRGGGQRRVGGRGTRRGGERHVRATI